MRAGPNSPWGPVTDVDGRNPLTWSWNGLWNGYPKGEVPLLLDDRVHMDTERLRRRQAPLAGSYNPLTCS
jgi:hypothetical protein